MPLDRSHVATRAHDAVQARVGVPVTAGAAEERVELGTIVGVDASPPRFVARLLLFGNAEDAVELGGPLDRPALQIPLEAAEAAPSPVQKSIGHSSSTLERRATIC